MIKITGGQVKPPHQWIELHFITVAQKGTTTKEFTIGRQLKSTINVKISDTLVPNVQAKRARKTTMNKVLTGTRIRHVKIKPNKADPALPSALYFYLKIKEMQ